jgi:hypothetical protein
MKLQVVWNGWNRLYEMYCLKKIIAVSISKKNDSKECTNEYKIWRKKPINISTELDWLVWFDSIF